MKSLLSSRPSKEKKILKYCSKNKGVVSIFLIENHVLRKNIKKFKKPQKKDGSKVEVSCHKSVKI
jgi:hypothetical protein